MTLKILTYKIRHDTYRPKRKIQIEINPNNIDFNKELTLVRFVVAIVKKCVSVKADIMGFL